MVVRDEYTRSTDHDVLRTTSACDPDADQQCHATTPCLTANCTSSALVFRRNCSIIRYLWNATVLGVRSRMAADLLHRSPFGQQLQDFALAHRQLAPVGLRCSMSEPTTSRVMSGVM